MIYRLCLWIVTTLTWILTRAFSLNSRGLKKVPIRVLMSSSFEFHLINVKDMICSEAQLCLWGSHCGFFWVQRFFLGTGEAQGSSIAPFLLGAHVVPVAWEVHTGCLRIFNHHLLSAYHFIQSVDIGTIPLGMSNKLYLLTYFFIGYALRQQLLLFCAGSVSISKDKTLTTVASSFSLNFKGLG